MQLKAERYRTRLRTLLPRLALCGEPVVHSRSLGSGGVSYEDSEAALLLSGVLDLLWACNAFTLGIESVGCEAAREEGLYCCQASLETGHCSSTNVARLYHYRSAKVRYDFSLPALGATSPREAGLCQGSTLFRS